MSMEFFTIFLFLQVSLVYKQVSTLDINSFFEPCSAKDPSLNECVKKTGQKFLPLLAPGIKEWNMPATDPMITPELTFKDNAGDNDLTLTYKNIEQTGFSKVTIDGADIDLAHGVMTFKLKYPIIRFAADYNANGAFYGFTVSGDGKANITVWDAFSSLVLKFRVKENHIKQNSLIIGFSFDKIYLDYTNLNWNGDKDLSESAGQFINENSKEIIESFKPELEKFYMKITGELLQAFFDAVPYNVLFKDV